MPGLAGIITNGTPLRNADEIKDVIENVHAIRGVSYVQRTFETQNAVICNVLTGLLKNTLNQPAATPSGDTVLFLEGEIFNCPELGKLVRDRPAGSTCEVLLALFQSFGDGFVARINGEFNIVVYQKPQMKLSIYSDHVASMPMYFLESGDRFVFGSEKKSILALLDAPPELDHLGLLQIFAHRHNLDDRTFLQGVRRMMPGSRIAFEQGRMSITRYHLMHFRVPPSLPTARELAELWASHLRRATTRRLQGKDRLLVSLSAGLDSRAVACAIPRDVRPVSARTRGSEDGLESRLAAVIAGRLGLEHFREDPRVSQYSAIIPKIAWRIECELHFSNGISLSNHRAIKQRGDFIIGGWLGDASSGAHISPFYLRPCARSEFLEQAYGRYLVYSARALSNIFSQNFLDRTFPQLKEAFLSSFDAVEAETNIQLFELWDLAQRQRRMTTSSMPVDSYAFEKIRPFYDKDYLNFALSLPSRYRFGQILYTSMIYELGPEIRDIPSANSGLRVHRSLLANFANKGIVEARKTIAKLNNKLLPIRLRRVRHGLSEDLAAETRRDAGVRSLIQEFTSRTDFDSSVFNRSGILNLVDQHYSGAADRSYELGYVATFAVGLPYFLNRTLRCPAEAEPL